MHARVPSTLVSFTHVVRPQAYPTGQSNVLHGQRVTCSAMLCVNQSDLCLPVLLGDEVPGLESALGDDMSSSRGLTVRSMQFSNLNKIYVRII